MIQYKTRGRRIFNMVNYTILILTSIVCVLPFLNLLAISFSSSTPVAAGKVTFWPIEPTLESYAFALKGGKFIRALGISMLRVILGVGLNVLLMVLTAYPLAKSPSKLKGRNAYMMFFVVTMVVSGGLIPTYLLVVKLGLLNSIWALVLPTALPVYNMVILMNFIRQLPEELEEAATLDGANEFTILFRIILPLLKPALATVGLFCIVSHWNDWFSGIIYIQNTKQYPLQTYLHTLLNDFEDMMRIASDDYVRLLSLMNVRTGRAAQLFLGALPVMLIYPFLQKYFTTGLVLGSVKG